MTPRCRTALPPVLAAAILAAAASSPAWAQGYFGKNKVVYDPREWRVLRTEHVEVYHDAAEEELARTVAAVAESACAAFDTTFRMRPRSRIPILTYGTHQAFQQSNATPGFIGEGTGGLTELIKGRVLIPHTGSYARLAWVTRHELVHAYTLERIAQEQKKARKRDGFYPPLWFIEGLAEFLSTTWDSQAEGMLQDAVVSGVAMPVRHSAPIEGTVLMYKEGQSFLEFVAERHGRRRILELFDHWTGVRSFEEAWQATFGEPLEEVDDDWFAAIKRRYYPRVATRRPLTEVARPLTCCMQAYELAPTVLPAVAGDSTMRIAYLRAKPDGGVDLRLRVERAGRVQSDHRLLEGGFSPRFESFHFFRSRIGASRDGRIALVAQAQGGDVLHLYDLSARRVTATFRFPGLVGLASPTWLAGDSALVVVGQHESGRTDLYLVHAADGALTQLTDDPSDEDDPAAHPTEPRVAFSSDRAGGAAGNSHLFSLDLATHELRQLTSGRHGERQPAWSPDGRTLAFLSDREGIDDLYLWRDGRVQRASRFLGPSYNPSWMPAGDSLVFAGQAGWEFHLYAVPVSPVDSLWLDEPVRAGREPFVAPPLAVEPLEGYTRRLSMDIATSVVGIDPALGAAAGGGMVGFSDLLGNEGLTVFLANDAASVGELLDGMEVGVTYFNRSRRLHHGVGVFRLSRTYDMDLDLVRYERRVGLSLLAAYPLNRYQRVEASAVVRYAQDHLLRRGGFADLWLLSNFVAFVHDDARHTFDGPLRGNRVNVTAGFTRDLSTGQGDYLTLTGELRKYVPLVPNVVWAGRLVGQGSFGDDRANFYLGGPFSLRGWERRSMAGTRTVALQQELRFPLLSRLRFGLLPFEFPRLSAALFGDAAVAWDLAGRSHQLGVVGFGVYVGGGYFPVLRLDFLKRTDLRTIEPVTRTVFTFGYSF